MGFFNKLKQQAVAKARDEIMGSLGMSSSGGGGGGSGEPMTAEKYEATKPDELKKDIRMISGCQDKQTSADVSNVSSFKLPDPAGE